MSDAESVNRLHQGHTLSAETRRALLANGLSTAKKRDRGLGFWPSFGGAVFAAGVLVWLAWELIK